MKTFHKGGIHPHDCKLTAGSAIQPVSYPDIIVLPLSQSIGAPAQCVVKVNDPVEEGTLIGRAASFVSANVHSPVKGVVKKIEKRRNPQGLWQDCVIIERDKEESKEAPLLSSFKETKPLRSDDEISRLSAKEITEIVRDCGIVGLGGATFPTSVKLTPPEGKIIDMVIINGAECEPYLTCDDMLMRERPSEIIAGVELLMKAVNAEKAVVGIEDNKPEAYRAMREAAGNNRNITVELVRKKYPQGSEKQLIKALTGRTVPTAALPAEVGALVDNVATAFAVYDAVYNGRPLTSRVVTITGPEMTQPGNFLVAGGTLIDLLIEKAGGMPEHTGKVIAGGPMMGRAVSNTEAPAVKGLSGILVMPEKMSNRKNPEPCIRCARCVSVCPMGLEPYLLSAYADFKEWDEAKEHGVLNCLECGCCSFVCPASRPLLDFIRLAKQESRKKK